MEGRLPLARSEVRAPSIVEGPCLAADPPVLAGRGLILLVPSARFERALTAPEADALSPELRGRGLEKTWEKTPGDANFGAGGMLAESSAAPARLAGGL